MKYVIALIAVFFAIATANAQSYPTIVGSWYLPEYGVADCRSHNGLHIEPMGLLSVETRCEFSNVARDGWKVTWRGQCGFSGNWVDNVTVTAVESNGQLSLRFGDGLPIEGFRRCPKQ